MKAKIKGIEVEGTPEEIAELIKLNGEKHVSNVQEEKTGKSLSELLKEYDFNSVNTKTYFEMENSPCKTCSNFGKGPCYCTLPFLNHPYARTAAASGSCYITTTGTNYKAEVSAS